MTTRWIWMAWALVAMPAAADDGASTDSGRNLFAAHCASCHGIYGEGDGPAAVDMGMPLPDLRYLAADNGGSFPSATVADIIDGRTFIQAHGPRRMPVWGQAFADLADGSASANEMIGALTTYLEQIQQPR